jgi:hypothetical protein
VNIGVLKKAFPKVVEKSKAFKGCLPELGRPSATELVRHP